MSGVSDREAAERAGQAVTAGYGGSAFQTLDSGERHEFESGMQRDTQEGKPRFDLLIPEGVAYRDQMLTRLAELFARGAEKYEDRNWERANTHVELARMKASGFRHFMQWYCGETDEDHAAAVMFNLIAYESTRHKMQGPVALAPATEGEAA